MVHAIGDSGKISQQASQSITTDEKAHAIVSDWSGEFIFVAHTGPSTIFPFRFDAEFGKLPYLSQATREKTPRSCNIDPSGRYLIAAGQNSATLASYRIKANGTLDLIGTTASGQSPWGVLIVDR